MEKSIAYGEEVMCPAVRYVLLEISQEILPVTYEAGFFWVHFKDMEN